MVGSALVRRLSRELCKEVLVAPRKTIDLRDQKSTLEWILEARPDTIFIAAAKVGGIAANSAFPVEYLYDNLMIAANIISAAHIAQVEKLMFLGSSCIYPKLSRQPIKESALLTGPLEPTNESYAIAKIAGIKLCQSFRKQYGSNFIVAMPTSLYGPGDNFALKNCHVIPALIYKTHQAKCANLPKIEVWGTGTPEREFLHVDDCADALVFLMQHYSGYEPVNVGFGSDISIAQLVQEIKECVGYSGGIEFDRTKPDGTPKKLLSLSVLNKMGWAPKISLRSGLQETYGWFLRYVVEQKV